MIGTPGLTIGGDSNLWTISGSFSSIFPDQDFILPATSEFIRRAMGWQKNRVGIHSDEREKQARAGEGGYVAFVRSTLECTSSEWSNVEWS